MSDKLELSDLWPLIDEVISTGGVFRMTPNGISMLPLIRPGVDSVSLVLPTDIKRGDIVLYKRDNGQYVLHRVIYIKNDEYVMCGDNQKVLEYGITKKHILAKLKDVYRDGKAIDTENKEYKKYYNRQLKKKTRLKIRRFLSKVKHTIIK